jgi:hypothetical protein
MMMIYFCCDERRLNAIKSHSTLNGIEFLEVVDDPNAPYEQRQHTLIVHLVKDIAPDALGIENVRIEGGERIREVRVTNVTVGAFDPLPLTSPPTGGGSTVLKVQVAEPGDFSTYTLRLVDGPGHPEPPTGFDPILSAVEFSFKVACPSDLDCLEDRICPSEPGRQPEINYLAKDYASFRRLMLDRLAVLIPQWQERTAADLGVVLVELLAYVGDYLSYQQDAVATEAYLNTARRRASVRRHARLVDYFMHDGSNARVWVQVRVRSGANNVLLKRGEGAAITKLLTRVESQPPLIEFKSSAYDRALTARPEVFELMHDVRLFADHNEMSFYTWGALECCLPKGATRATLRGSLSNLKPGDVLILAEVRGPKTGEPEDADPTHRHAVRLKKVNPLQEDPLGGRFEDPPHDGSVPVTDIEWEAEDALPFPLCISARAGTAFYDEVSVACGNIVLADHGLTMTDEPDDGSLDPDDIPSSLDPDTVPQANPALTKVRPPSGDRCIERPVVHTPPRFRPRLKFGPLTHAAPYDPQQPPASARAAMRWTPDMALPVITLNEPGKIGAWIPKRDLLNSGPGKEEFVVEVESDGTAFLRFGDDRFGSRPASGTKFLATYRIGNGVRGNVGAEALAHIVSDDPALVTDLSDPVIIGVSNPLPAQGGIDPESMEEVRQRAPSAFRTQERAVTPADYAAMTQRCDLGVQRAAATLRWTGSWRTVFLTVDRLGGEEVDADFERSMRQCLERYRMAGHDVEVDGPRPVSLEIDMTVCVKRGYLTSDVKAALLDVFSNRILPDGQRGVFHPDKFTFGQPVYLSPLYAAAQSVAGVDSVKITKFQRQGIDSAEALDAGKLELERLEIARLDNDPNFPERGVFTLLVLGG